MSTTSRRSWLGLFVLAVIALAVFLITFLLKKKAATTKANLPRPQRSNNPFAIIQLAPDKWAGMTGTDPGTPAGFLTFDTAVNGVRAGFINLYNGYYKQGLRSIKAIVPRYLGDDYGWNSANDIRAYAAALVQFTGYTLEQQLTWPQMFDLGRAIERFENGYQWVPIEDFTQGYTLATQYTKAR